MFGDSLANDIIVVSGDGSILDEDLVDRERCWSHWDGTTVGCKCIRNDIELGRPRKRLKGAG